ncbi:MAG: Smr/MutS family protein [Saprospiraceae bacterium]|nr:Smr/MutS family protein [Saprospiraceae bacterium]
MFYEIGTKVRLKFTGETGKIVRLMEQNMYEIWIDDTDIRIPVFVEDFERNDGMDVVFKKLSTKNGSELPQLDPSIEIVIPDFDTYKPLGFQIAFEPNYKKDETIEDYTIYVINDTYHELVYDLAIFIGEDMILEESGKLLEVSVNKAGNLLFDDLNENPVIEVSISRVTTEGLVDTQQKELTLKANQFFKKQKVVPLLMRLMHHYLIFDKVEGLEVKKTESAESLKDYTKQHLKPTPSNNINISRPAAPPKGRIPNKNEVFDYANFPIEIDLHIEKLYKDYAKLSNSDIIKIQLMAFEQYFLKAKNMGISKFYIIHGVGKGKLREAIWRELDSTSDVYSYKNEYHSKYGYGATEVIINYD